MSHQQLLAGDVDGVLRVVAVSGGEDAHQAGGVVQAVERCCVGDEPIVVQHPLVQPRVHALACEGLAPGRSASY